jgi:hypothetical protein
VTRYHLEAVRQETLLSKSYAGTPQLTEQAVDNEKRAVATLALNRCTAMGLVYRDIDQSSGDVARAFLEIQYQASPIGSPSHKGGPHWRNVNLDVFDAGV